MNTLVRIRSAQPTKGFRVRIEFTDGTIREVNLEPYLRGPVFQQMKADLKTFRSFRVDARMGTLVWDNGADIDPDVLYRELDPAWMESLPLTSR